MYISVADIVIFPWLRPRCVDILVHHTDSIKQL